MRTLVVYCHPDPDSFTASVRNTVVAALATARHEVRLTDLYTEGFEPRLSAEERLAHSTVEIADSLSSRGLTRYTEDLRWCESIVLVYPTWWSGQPAMLKGWIDRVWIQGVAWELPEGANRLVPLLKNVRRMTVVTTHGSSKWINALEGEAGKRIAFRSKIGRASCRERV